jgi:hypothetical protein
MSSLPIIIGVLTLGVAFAEQPSTVNVRDYGARGDGKTDDTSAFQEAMAVVAGKGGVVTVPVGNYLIATHLVIPANVTLEGVWKTPTAWTQNEGSTLLAVEGEGQETGTPFITLDANSTIKGLTVFYPNQKKDKIVPYPWCVACAGGDNSAIVDCLLVNPYQGVDFGSKPSGRHYIRNLYGQPLRRGLFVDQCYDIGRIENVHFWPFWSWDGSQYIQDWLWKNGEAFIFARTDWEYVFNTFCFGYKIGYKFTGGANGPCNGNFLGIGADASVIAVLVEQSFPYGLLITNGEFVAMSADDATAVVAGASNTGTVQFQNCAFWGPSNQIAKIDGSGYVSFNNCNFCDWAAKGKDVPAFSVLGGALSITGCNFRQKKRLVEIGPNAESLIFTSNHLAGSLQIANPNGIQAQIGLNVEGQPAPAR